MSKKQTLEQKAFFPHYKSKEPPKRPKKWKAITCGILTLLGVGASDVYFNFSGIWPTRQEWQQKSELDELLSLPSVRTTEETHPGLKAAIDMYYDHQYDAAMNAFENLKEDSDPIIQKKSSLWKGRIFLLQGKDTKGEATINGSGRDGKGLDETYLFKARYLLKRKNVLSAKDELEKALSLRTDNPHAYRIATWVDIETEDIEAAVANAKKAVRLDSGDFRNYNTLGWAMTEAGRVEDGIQVYEHALELNPKSSSALVSLGYLNYRKKGDTETAKEYYEKALEIDELCAAALNNIGNIHQEKGEYEQAIGYLEKAVKLNRYILNYRQNLAYTYYKLNQLKEAWKVAEGSTRIDPTYAKAYAIFGLVKEKIGDQQGAIIHFQKAVSLDTENTTLVYNLGRALAENNDHREAIPHLEKVLEKHPKWIDAKNYLGFSLLWTGELDKAETILNQVLDENNSYAWAYKHLGTISHMRNEDKKAYAQFKQAYELRPALGPPSYHIGELVMQEGMDTMRKPEGKFTMATPEDQPIFESKTHFLMPRREKIDQGIAYLKTAIEEDPSFPSTYYALGQGFYYTKREKEALKWFEEAGKLGVDISHWVNRITNKSKN